MKYSLFGSRVTFAAAADRLEGLLYIAEQGGLSAAPEGAEQAAALWQIAFELSRIAAVLEEAHK